MELHHREEMKRTIDTLISTHKLINKNVIAFGHCNATEEMLNYLSEHKITAEVILDNNGSKQEDLYNDIRIVSPQYIKRCSNESSIVLIATRFFEPMSVQLRAFGYTGQIVKVVDYNSFTEYSLSDETLRSKIERMQRGTKTLGDIRRKYPSQHLIVCPNNALGDVYWAMSFLPAYQEKLGCCELAVIVIGNACRQVAELFNRDNVIALNHIEMDELVQAIIFNRESNCIIAHHDRPYTDNIIKWLDNHLLTFIDYYKYAVYGLVKDARPVMPRKFIPFENREKIQKGKAVILSPYAKSVVELQRGFWEKISADYLEKGLQVYTNVVGNEQPIAGTQPLTVPISQMPAVAEHAGHFIGIRSGLCDVLSTANCHKTVVFADCYYSTTPHKIADFFMLPGWENIVLENEK